jgi:hypothetical protein
MYKEAFFFKKHTQLNEIHKKTDFILILHKVSFITE